MTEKSVILIIFLSFLIGSIFGFGISYVVYNPQIESLNNRLTGLNSEIDSKLDDIQIDITDLQSKSGELEEESKVIGTVDTNVNEIIKRLDSLENRVQNEETIIDVYNTVSPAVVFITSTVLTFDFQLQQEVPSEGVGSGVVVSPEGYILTNNHVVEDAEEITVSFSPGEEIEAELIGTDPPTDLAVLKIDPPQNLPVAALGNSDNVRIGMTTIAIGNPFSLERTVTVGVVSSVNRTIDAETGDIIFGVIQTDASVNPGNSGGPLVNSRGEVIGINSAIISPVRGSVGIGFAIPINTAKKVMTQLIEKGRVSRPYLGITGGSVGEFPGELNLTDKGVLIVDVIIDSPADKAGLRGSGSETIVNMVVYPFGGDIIRSIDNIEIDTIEDLLEVLSNKEVGQTIVLEYLRDGLIETTQVLLEERPET